MNELLEVVLNNQQPICNLFGLTKGTPLDRIYIEDFMKQNQHFIKGNVLEIGDDRYSKLLSDKNSNIKILKRGFLEFIDGGFHYMDLEHETVFENYYDCIIATNVISSINDYKTCCENLFKLLKPNGVLLLTVPCITMQTKEGLYDCLNKNIFTTYSLENSFKNLNCDLEIKSLGNLKLSFLFLSGCPFELIKDNTIFDSEYNDEKYPILLTLKLIKK